MLKKLLKYDFKFLFKYWWIAAVVCLSLSIASGFCLRLLNFSTEVRELPAVVDTSASSLIAISIISYIAIAIICTILIFTRFYKNFFSDEGYLTFTLPVKHTHLLNSKIISSVLMEIATILLIGLGVVFMLVIGYWEEVWKVEVWKDIFNSLEEFFKENTICRIIYIIEFLLMSVLSIIISNLFLFCCITFASIITKKARVITTIGIYFGVNCAITFTANIFTLFGIDTLYYYLENSPDKWYDPLQCLVGLGFILFLGIFCVGLYLLQYRMLDRKLNLA